MKRFMFTMVFLFLTLPVIAPAQVPSLTGTTSQAFIAGSITVKGEGVAPTNKPLNEAQKKILAFRAAKVMALRELAEILEGVAISGETLVKDASVASDVVRATVQAMVKGARVVHESYDEILYDPTKIAQNILVERGAGDYTNDVGKAKAILSERGSKNPLVIKASGVVKFTDVQVTGDDAANIFTANQKSNFLEGAKVVFVLK
ncbi:MAG: hypothetical protein HZB54_01850 [Deltaproteobacteria bacterium]|nr:hypothetical protein [Deltaproteobacteria bacterium]